MTTNAARRPRILTIGTLKGGNAKTTTSLALAGTFAREGLHVMILDADPQSTATRTFRIRPVPEPWTAEPVALEIEEGIAGTLTLVRGGRALAKAGPRFLEMMFDREGPADVVIVDTSPAYPDIITAAISVSDLVLVPLEPSPYSTDGLVDVVELARTFDPPPPIRAVLTRVHARRSITGELAARIEQRYPGMLYPEIRIPEDARCLDAAHFGKPVTLYEPGCRAAKAYVELAAAVGAELGLGVPTLTGGGHGAA